MIVKCPKCNANFDVDDKLINKEEMKFQCSDCAFIWNEKFDISNIQVENETETKIPSCLNKNEVEHQNMDVNFNSKRVKKSFNITKLFLYMRGGMNLLLIIIFIILLYLLVKIVPFETLIDGDKKQNNVSKSVAKEMKPFDGSGLYIELIKPLDLITEGDNVYIIVKGFVYNPQEIELDIPKMVVRLENENNKILQEQEQEIEQKKLPPKGKVEFMFKVFKFSQQVKTVRVDFIDVNKI